MLKDKKIICVSDVHWDGRQVCEQNVTKRLAIHNGVFYMERPVSFMTQFTNVQLQVPTATSSTYVGQVN